MADGHPLAKRGESVRALRMATVASVSGDLIGDFILILGAAFVASQTAKFGPPEYFAVYDGLSGHWIGRWHIGA